MNLCRGRNPRPALSAPPPGREPRDRTLHKPWSVKPFPRSVLRRNHASASLSDVVPTLRPHYDGPLVPDPQNGVEVIATTHPRSRRAGSAPDRIHDLATHLAGGDRL